MRKVITLLFMLIAVGASQTIEAKGVIVYHNGATFTKTQDLPADETIDGKHVNLGVAYEQFGLFWLPVWNYGDVQYALVSDDEESAWLLDEEQLKHIKETYSLELEDKADIPMMSKIGLKPILLLLAIFIIWGYLPSRKKDEEIEEGAE